MDRHELAWAAGFFDGEGWANRSGRGVQARINQAGLDGMPEVLVKFQRIVGVGRLKGPDLADGRQPLYHWEATSRSDLRVVVSRIGPWLCPRKRRAFERALGVRIACDWPGTQSEELAWAGGLFDGEGSTYVEPHRTHESYFVPRMDLPQTARRGVAPELLRFKQALNGMGFISGPRRSTRANHTPYRRWRVYTEADLGRGLHLLLPWIGNVKRRQALATIAVVGSQAQLPRGNPAWGNRKTHCLRGHEYATARIRPYKSRGGGRERRDSQQCLTCVRDDARTKRKNVKNRTDGQ